MSFARAGLAALYGILTREVSQKGLGASPVPPRAFALVKTKAASARSATSSQSKQELDYSHHEYWKIS